MEPKYADIPLRVSLCRVKEIFAEAETPTSLQQHVLSQLMLDEANSAAGRAWDRVANAAERRGIYIAKSF